MNESTRKGIPYELIDMILLAVGDIDIIIDLHRNWIGKYLLESWYIPTGKLLTEALKTDNVKFIKFLYENHEAQYSIEAIKDATSSGSLQIIKYLHSIDQINLSGNEHDLTIRYACLNDHYNIILYIWRTTNRV
jgi:hypothetical protein